MRILLVEDDQLLANALVKTLKLEHFTIDHVATGQEALRFITSAQYDLMILDLGLPDMNGIQVLQKLKSGKQQLPVLVLTAKSEITDKVKGLDAGADDYLCKPFDMMELIARIRVFERRASTVHSHKLTVGNVTLDTLAHHVYIEDQPLEISKKEYMVLKALMENLGRIQSRAQIEAKLYDWGEDIASNAVEVHISNLRKKLPSGFIKTVRGVGYTVNQHDLH